MGKETTKMNKDALAGHLSVGAAYVIFGLNIVFCRDIATESGLAPIVLFSMRALVAAALFWLVSLFTPREKVPFADLMKIFGGDMITSVYNGLGADEDMPLQHGFLSKAVENAQKRVEGNNFSIRKNVLKYDDVMNQQREIIYAQRREVLDGKDLSETISNMIILEKELLSLNEKIEKWLIANNVQKVRMHSLKF